MNRILILFLFVGCFSFGAEPLTIYGYDSLGGKHGYATLMIEKFKKAFNEDVKFISFGSAGEALNQVAIEGAHSKADLVMGADVLLLQRAKTLKLFQAIESGAWKSMTKEVQIDPEHFLLPFDYGYLAFVYDSSRIQPKAARTLSDFVYSLGPAKNTVIEDPRTSSIGMDFLIWTKTSWGGQFEALWKVLGSRLVTIAPGWSGAYDLFLKKEADWVLSYSTSPAYHSIEEKKEQYQALIFPEGHFQQVEGFLLPKDAKKKDLARKFMELCLAPEGQFEIPTHQWMYPVRTGTLLPEAFKKLPIPKPVWVDWKRVELEKENWTKAWSSILSDSK